ncbi:hypothetical protein OQA88_3858 [Cercophora sp. LCS_1]
MSVFTFEEGPQRVSSPWLKSDKSGEPSETPAPKERVVSRRESIKTGVLSEYGIAKLNPEPQDGPTEYKLHLLLRPRRKYERTSTSTKISGSIQSRPPSGPRTAKAAPAVGSASNQGRQDRLHHLTTQLLWRLQQTCPHHTTSGTSKLVVPTLPDGPVSSDIEIKPGKLIAGIEASKGALYEIGVADDGTLIGLTQDELDESLNVLRVMASSLGCHMKIIREVLVGDCEWIDSSDSEDSTSSPAEPAHHHEKLWVAEAIVTPDLKSIEVSEHSTSSEAHQSASPVDDASGSKRGPLTTDQLRVTLTGPTTSGKSTLLGTLANGTLDNGRGSNRLGLLRHAHEVNSGITSSIAQELIGYNEGKIINYEHPGVESWVDIHTLTETGRLAFLSDSAGHLRYRRTVIRGLIGSAPHWTLLCVAADSGDKTETSSTAELGVGISLAYLDLCLKLKLPLVIAITKSDIAKASLRSMLQDIMAKIKATGRTSKFIKPGPNSAGMHAISELDRKAVKPVLDGLVAKDDLLSVIPIVLTSAVNGTGIGILHALLQSLPLPPGPTSHDYIGAALNPEQPKCLFHIEEKYNLTAAYALETKHGEQQTDNGAVVVGYLRFGNLAVGDKVILGPFPPEDGTDSPRVATPDDRLAPGSYGLSNSHPSSTELSRSAAKSIVSASAIKGEWHAASIVSIRNLRLPVQTLTAGQAGSVGIVFDSLPKTPKIRTGMVLAVASDHMNATGLSLQAVSGLTVVFEDVEAASLSVGTHVHIYVASVRTIAKVLRVQKAEDDQVDGSKGATDDNDVMFDLSEEMGDDGLEFGSDIGGAVKVQLELLSRREWIELGSSILVLEEQKQDRVGLEGFMGKVVEIEE